MARAAGRKKTAKPKAKPKATAKPKAVASRAKPARKPKRPESGITPFLAVYRPIAVALNMMFSAEHIAESRKFFLAILNGQPYAAGTTSFGSVTAGLFKAWNYAHPDQPISLPPRTYSGDAAAIDPEVRKELQDLIAGSLDLNGDGSAMSQSLAFMLADGTEHAVFHKDLPNTLGRSDRQILLVCKSPNLP